MPSDKRVKGMVRFPMEMGRYGEDFLSSRYSGASILFDRRKEIYQHSCHCKNSEEASTINKLMTKLCTLNPNAVNKECYSRTALKNLRVISSFKIDKLKESEMIHLDDIINLPAIIKLIY